jgi:glutathione peroxidase
LIQVEQTTDIQVSSSQGELKLADHKNKALILVNVASKCGLTPQYKDLQALQDKYKDSVQIIGCEYTERV